MSREQIILHVKKNELFEARGQINKILLMSEEAPKAGVMISKAIYYIKTNYMNQINLSDVASYVNISNEYLCRLFREIRKMSVKQYINFVRMNSAEELLLRTSLSVEEIAVKVGFTDTGYFIKRFKVMNDCTPGRFRTILSPPFRKMKIVHENKKENV